MTRLLYLICAIIIPITTTLLMGCEEKFNLLDLPDPGQPVVIGDTNYIEIVPPWGGFVDPKGIIVGNDQLIYVADYGNNEVVMMNAAGVKLGSRTVLRPVAIAQNNKLDLYIAGEAVVPNQTNPIGAIYKINLVRFDTTYLSRVDTVIIGGDTTFIPTYRDTSFFYYHDIQNARMRIVWQEPARPRRRFTGIGVFPDNEYLVTRVGDDNSSFVDPDSRVLLFNKNDILVGPVGDLATRPTGGTAITDINQLTGITTFPASRDFIVTQSIEGVAFGAIWMVYRKTADFDGWVPRYDPTNPEQRGVDIILRYRFQKAVAAAVDRRRRDIFILDAQLDSVSKFDRNGNFKPESFGRAKSKSGELPSLNNPQGIAFSNDCTLYIADSGNKLVRRFRLSTQTVCN